MNNSTKKTVRLLKLSLAITALFTANVGKSQFTAGNVVVVQVGDGVATLANTGNAIILKEYNTSGTNTYSVAIPNASTSTNPLIMSGSATSEGGLTLAANNRYLVFAGYAQNLTNTTSVSGAASSAINRGIGIVDAAGSYTRVTTSSTFHSANNIRSAASDGTNNYWSAGANDGTNYFGTASTATNVQNSNTNTRCISTVSGNLYFSTGSGSQGIYKVGSGFPVTSGQTTTLVIGTTGSGTGSPSPYAFCFNPAQTICYIADDRSIANGGGIQKWVYSSSTWSLSYTLGTGSVSTVGARGVIADFSGTTPIVYATTAESTGNRLISILDASSSATATTIATATTNAIFRGVTFAPCDVPTISSVAASGTICAGQTLSLTATATSASSLTYAWTGTGTFASPSASTTALSGAANGTYTLTASNGCGSSSSTVAVTVVGLPTLSINSSTTSVCVGQTLTLTASGASTYTWSNGVSNGVSHTPTTTSIYTVTGTANTCSNSSTIAITVNPLPALNPSSVTICSGQNATLSAASASSYTWNTGSNSSSIVVTPSVTTNYTVAGTSTAGCLNTFTTQIVVTNSPAITLNSSTICSGSSATLVAGGANTFTWSNGASTSSIVVSPQTNTTYVVSGGLAGCPGIATNTAIVTVNSTPTLLVSGATSVCAGSALTQTLSGATSYSWNSISNGTLVTITPTANANYTVIATSASGCSATAVRTISVLALPVISLAGGSLVCSGSTITQTLSGASAYTVNGSVASSSVLTFTPASTSTYSVVGLGSNGCISSISKTITVNAAPVLTLSSSSSTSCAGSSVTLTVNGASTYSWSQGGLGVSAVINPTVTTTYTVTGISTASCSSKSQITQQVSTCTSIDKVVLNRDYSVYPNPASTFVMISNLSAKNEIRLVNALGAVVLIKKDQSSEQTLDISMLSKGVYFIQIVSGSEINIKKLIIE